MILTKLCRSRLSQLKGEQVPAVLLKEGYPQEVLTKCIQQTGLSEKDLITFLESTKYSSHAEPMAELSSLKTQDLPSAWPEQAVEDTRVKLRTALSTFHVLLIIRDRIGRLIEADVTLSTIERCQLLRGCVPKSVASPDTVNQLLGTLEEYVRSYKSSDGSLMTGRQVHQ